MAISFVIAGVVCGLAALCYAEFASTVPVAGSAYTFSYATFGELVAWIIGWDLVLELALGAATVSVGWSGYLNQLLDDIGHPAADARSPARRRRSTSRRSFSRWLMTGVLVLGIKLSRRVNAGRSWRSRSRSCCSSSRSASSTCRPTTTRPSSRRPQPTEAGSAAGRPADPDAVRLRPSTFGWGGVIAGAAIVFFAFIGFDIVATAAEETRNPERDLPRGILGSLAICTVLYVAVSLVVVGMQNYTELNADAPLAGAFSARRAAVLRRDHLGRRAGRPDLGGHDPDARPVAGAVRDEPRPPAAAVARRGAPALRHAVPDHHRHRRASWRCWPAFVPLEELAELVNIGTLFAFVLVSIGVIVLRRTRPDLPRAFRVPLMPVLPAASRPLACLWLMLQPARRHLAPVPRLDGARLRRLRRLRPPAAAGFDDPGRPGGRRRRERRPDGPDAAHPGAGEIAPIGVYSSAPDGRADQYGDQRLDVRDTFAAPRGSRCPRAAASRPADVPAASR